MLANRGQGAVEAIQTELDTGDMVAGFTIPDAKLAADLGGSPEARLLARDLKRFLNDRTWSKPEGARPQDAPPGSPIGMEWGCGFPW